MDENIALYSNKKIYLEAIEMQEIVFLFTLSGPKCLGFYCTYLSALSRLCPPPRIHYIQKSTGNVELKIKIIGVCLYIIHGSKRGNIKVEYIETKVPWEPETDYY